MLCVENLLNCNQVVGMFKLNLSRIVFELSRITFADAVLKNTIQVNFAQIVLNCRRISEVEVYRAASLIQEKCCTDNAVVN